MLELLFNPTSSCPDLLKSSNEYKFNLDFKTNFCKLDDENMEYTKR